MIKINLIPKEQLDKIEKKLLIVKASISAFIVILILSLLSIWQIARAKTLDVEFSKKTAEYEALKNDIKKNEEINAQITEVTNYINAIDRITKNRFLYVVFMQDLVNNLPSTIWFTGIDTRTKDSGIEVNLNVQSNSLYDMAWWLSFLEKNERFSSPSIGNITAQEQGEGTVYFAPFSFQYNYK